ncbi:oxygenase MpaB family protein [Nonomuraea aridisoli]|uniref:oxygenase MpaB family protein n=1 Tax=Nonomuraea aridisoli TaxID=2070368 RepID=UPI0015E8B4CC|nr:oxygenase MpaB family protein [Nonomuraea aridisoli]
MNDHDARWPEERFRQLRRQADPEIDKVVAEYLQTQPDGKSALELVKGVIEELGRAKREARAPSGEPPASEIFDALDFAKELPEWGDDKESLARGQAVFADYGLYQAAALFCKCLPMAYVEVSSAKVLAGVSNLATHSLTRRVAETGQMLVDVMGLKATDSLQPGRPGHTTAIGLRILHSFVRAVVHERFGDRWDTERYGPPVNQELLLATIFDFSVVTWEALETMGVVLTEEQRAAHLYTWSVFGHLMGVDTCRDGPLTLADVEPVSLRLGRLYESSDEGRLLMARLLEEMEAFMHLGWRKLPRSLVHWMFRDAAYGADRVPELLGVPKPAWWCTALFAAARAAHRHGRLAGPVDGLIRLLVRRMGRHVVVGMIDRHSGGQAPFRIPEELARAWRIRQSAAAVKTRAIRHRTRQRLRHGRAQGGPHP